MKTKREITALVERMTIEEKASLCSGLSFWNTKAVERLGIPSIMVADGPHGLRKQGASVDHLGINKSVPATCFPPACATACSFDRELLTKVGEAIGEECLQENVSVVLGPGANIKRSPLCGRNFEYFSEDPVLSGEMAAAFIRGVESKGVGTSLKHFAANNQERGRMVVNAVIDERALREIYLKSFEIAVKKGQPTTVMCAYNKLNGTYCCENTTLLSDILRTEWGFDGIVMTDWGAMNDRVEALKAGLELQMPAANGVTDRQLVAAVQSGELDIQVLDRAAERMVAVILKAAEQMNTGYQYDAAAHHALARKVATQSAVLLKNQDNLLPVKQGATIAVIGAFAKTPRYQGAGSSKINPHKVDSILDGLTAEGIAFDYAPGYQLADHNADSALIAQACAIAKGKDVVIIAAGLPDAFESEGFDRTDLNMPESHNRLIAEVSAANPNVVVVLMSGSAVLMPWLGGVKAVLHCYLTGQAGGSGIADLLMGRACPSGKLAESYPLSLEDTPCYNYFPGVTRSAEYRESIFVGYRYYDTAGKPVLFPFGHGLSYTTFAYTNLIAKVDENDHVTVSLEVTNTGKVEGAEVVQLYIAKPESTVLRPRKELKDFAKVPLKPAETKTVEFALDRDVFAFYCTEDSEFQTEGGAYKILAAASADDIRLSTVVQLKGQTLPAQTDSGYRKEYDELSGQSLTISDAAFTALYGRSLPIAQRVAGEPYTVNSTLGETLGTPAGDLLFAQIQQQMSTVARKRTDDIQRMFQAMMMDMPLRAMGMISGGAVGPTQIADTVTALNADTEGERAT